MAACRHGAAACADCHRPELALADGEPTSRGVHGPLARNAPTLYDVAFKDRLFWDRRSPSLEAQVFEPLFSPDEMAADPVELLARLRAIPEYVRYFERAFPDREPAIDLDALARSLNDSLNVGVFSVEAGALVFQSQLTFVDRIRAAEMLAFLDWLDTAELAIARVDRDAGVLLLSGA